MLKQREVPMQGYYIEPRGEWGDDDIAEDTPSTFIMENNPVSLDAVHCKIHTCEDVE